MWQLLGADETTDRLLTGREHQAFHAGGPRGITYVVHAQDVRVHDAARLVEASEVVRRSGKVNNDVLRTRRPPKALCVSCCGPKELHASCKAAHNPFHCPGNSFLVSKLCLDKVIRPCVIFLLRCTSIVHAVAFLVEGCTVKSTDPVTEGAGYQMYISGESVCR